MSKLARALTPAAMLAAINLTGLTAIAQAHATDQPTGQADATVQRLLARERSSIPNIPNGAAAQAAADATHRRLQAQERYYSTWDYGNTSAPAPPEPSGQPGWLTPALGGLAAVLALVAGVALLAARRTGRSHRAEQTA
jgi:hypothetical protein